MDLILIPENNTISVIGLSLLKIKPNNVLHYSETYVRSKKTTSVENDLTIFTFIFTE